MLKYLVFLAIGTAMTVAGCGGESSSTTGPPDTPDPGSLRASVATSGPSAPASYSVRVDDLADRTVPANGSVLVGNLSPGEHQVALNNVPASCSVDGDNPRDVSVTSGTETATRFDVTCVPTTGGISVELITTGEGSDPTGYTIVLDGGARSEAAESANGVVQVNDVPPGTYSVELREVAANCEVQAPTVHEVAVVVGETAEISFVVECAAPPPLANRILYFSERDGAAAIRLINPDGSDPATLPAPVSDQGAAWPDISSDGGLIAYTLGSTVVVIQPDGNVIARLGVGFGPTWSPDDTRLAFAYAASGETEQIWTMATDGSGRTRLADSNDTFEWEPEWGPDGRIVYVRAMSGHQRLWVVNTDGMNSNPVTVDEVFDEGEPAWSPDGEYLLFSRTLEAGGTPDLWVVGSDLQDPRNLTDSPGYTDAKGAWSPDGSQILFESNRDGDVDLYVINFDGTGLTQLTDDAGYDGDATWSP